jgi:hypothetical protein
MDVEQEKDKWHYSELFFPTSAFDGMVQSGIITHLDGNDQKALSDIYLYIRYHNETISRLKDNLIEFEMNAYFTTLWSKNLSPETPKEFRRIVLERRKDLTGWEVELAGELVNGKRIGGKIPTIRNELKKYT